MPEEPEHIAVYTEAHRLSPLRRRWQLTVGIGAGVCVLAAIGIVAATVAARPHGSGTATPGPRLRDRDSGSYGFRQPGATRTAGYRLVHRLDPGGAGTSVTSVALSRGAVLAATGGSAGSAQVWNVATGLRQGPALTVRDAQRVLAVAFSPDGAILATGCANGTTYLWNTASGKLAIVAGGGLTYRWQSRAASATVSATGTLTDPATGAADASSVAFGASGTWLVTGDPSGSAQIWESRS